MSANARVIEALLFVASEPLDERALALASGLSEPDLEEGLQAVGLRHAAGCVGPKREQRPTMMALC